MRKLSTAVVLAACVLSLTATATVASQSQVVADCVAHGRLTQTYSAGQLRIGLATMNADTKEYTNCQDVLQRALLAQLAGTHPTGNGSGSGSGGSFLPTPVIVVLVLLALAAVTFGAFALRSRRGPPDDPAGPPGAAPA
jgi:hypothetical protein